MKLGSQGFNSVDVLHSYFQHFIIFSTILFYITFLYVEVVGQQNPYNAVIFWNGVNGNQFNSISNKFSWQENAK